MTMFNMPGTTDIESSYASTPGTKSCILLLLSSLWDRVPKDCTEGKDCSKVLS